MMTYKKTRGFTLIELLVVVLIIGILVAVAVPQYQKAVDKSRMTQAFVWAETIAKAEQVYKLANGEYTHNLEELDVSFSECTEEDDVRHIYSCADTWKIKLTDFSVYVYLPSRWLPAETEAGVEYYYDYDTYYNQYVRLCYATSDRFRNVCKNMGAVTHSGTKLFRFP